VLPCAGAAESFVGEFLARLADESPKWLIATPNNSGARIEIGAKGEVTM
jgi:hypothetical protein